MTIEVFYFVISICALALTGVLVWTCTRVVKTLTEVDGILSDVRGAFSTIELFKDGLKMGLSTLISALVTRLRLPAEKTKEVKTK